MRIKKILLMILIILALVISVKATVFADPSDTGGSPLKSSTPISSELTNTP